MALDPLASCPKCGDVGHGARGCRANLPEKCGQRCEFCADLAHRRDKPKCRGCDEPWEPEVLVHEIPTPRSGCHGF